MFKVNHVLGWIFGCAVLTAVALTAVALAQDAEEEFPRRMGYPELMSMLNSGDIQLIDVRNRTEIAETGRIPSALNIPLWELKSALELSPAVYAATYGRRKPQLDDDNIVFTCRTLRRSGLAVDMARAMGYTKARHYIGGWLGWVKTRTELGLPILWSKREMTPLEPLVDLE